MSVFTKEKVYWTGPRESDIEAVKDLFAGSITIFGSNKNGNCSFCNSSAHTGRVDHNRGTEADRFILDKALELYKKDPSVKFMLYNGNAYNAFDDFAKLKDAILCRNDSELMKKLNDKNYFHRHFEEEVEEKPNVLKIIPRNGADCYYSSISDLLCGEESWREDCRYIVQAPVASGGNGTFILDRKNSNQIRERLGRNQDYLVSIYQENNISVNIHAIIYDEEILILPGSIQIMKEDDDRLMYRGADFIAYKRWLDEGLRKEFIRQARIACREFQEMGYRGVCGVDAIFTGGKVLLLEVNNRFQASTNLLNKALRENGLKTVPELNYDAFTKPCPDKADYAAQDIEVNYSNFVYVYNDTNCHSDNILARASICPHVCDIDFDGYDPAYKGKYPEVAHLFRINFNTNIVWVNEDHTLNLHENVVDPIANAVFGKTVPERWKDMIDTFDKNEESRLAFKVALMTQGVVITKAAAEYLSEHGGFRPATHNAIDLRIMCSCEGFVVNAPLYVEGTTPDAHTIKFTEFSPFSLDAGGEGLILRYYGKQLCAVKHFGTDELQSRVTRGGVPFSKVGYFSTDRLRLHLTNYCRFKRNDEGCRFCNMETDSDECAITAKDLREVVYAYYQAKQPRHYLIGGQSAAEDVAPDKLIETIGAIRYVDKSHSINAMIVPCDPRTMQEMKRVGLNEITCNIEIYNDALRAKYMPGKGRIPVATYFDLLQRAEAEFNRPDSRDNVRSMLIVGLEPESSTMECVEELVKRGVQPLLSVFRPLPETQLADLVPPAMDKLCALFRKAEEVCKKRGLHLGPPCRHCQNNTLSLPYTD